MTSLLVKPSYMLSQRFSQSQVPVPCPLERNRVSRALFGKPSVGDSEALLKQELMEKSNEFFQTKIILQESSKETILPNKVDTSTRFRKSSERQKPYEKQTCLTSFYNQRKNGGCDRRVTSETHSIQTAEESLLNPIQDGDSEIENSSTISASDFITNESSHLSNHISEQQQTLSSKQQIALDTINTTTDLSAELV